MPRLNEGESAVSYEIGPNLNEHFSEIVNCTIRPMMSESGIAQNQWRLTARDGLDNYATGTSSVGPKANKQVFFFTGVDGNRNVYVIHGGELWKQNGSTLTNIGAAGDQYDLIYNIVKLPHTFVLEGTSSATATGVEKIKVAVGTDTTPVNNVGKYLMLTGESTPTKTQYNTTDVYRNKYALIIGYDSTNAEYLLEGFGNATAIQSGAKYSIFEKLEEYIQVMDNNPDINNCYEAYYDGVAFQTRFWRRLREHFNQYFQGLKIKKLLNYDGLTWAFTDKALHRSQAKNFLYFALNESFSNSINDSFNDAFVWKDKLIVGGKRSVVSYTKIANENAYLGNVISSNYGILKGGINDFEKDVYVLTTGGELISFAENQTGIILPTNVGQKVQKYLDYYKYNIKSAFDGRRFYITGSYTDGLEISPILVYDTKFKFWSTYEIPTGMGGIVAEADRVYVTGSIWPTVYVFSPSKIGDVNYSNAISQRLATEYIEGSDVFAIKEGRRVEFEFDNLTQRCDVKVRNGLNGTKYDKDGVVSLTNISNDSMKIPRLVRYQLDSDQANVFKVVLTNDGDQTKIFHLRSMHFIYRNVNSDYMNPVYVTGKTA